MKKRADGRYPAKVKLPNGEIKYVYGRTKEELKENKNELLLQYSLGATNIDKKITVHEWAVKWWKVAKKGKTGPSSQETYVSCMDNYIIPYMGSMKLIEVRLIHVQELINKMGEKGLSESLQKKVLITLNGMFKYAIRNGMIVGNPAEFAEIYEVPVNEVVALTPKQVKELLKLCNEWPRTKYSTRADRAELTIHIGLYLGLRRGEIIAAQWTDLDEETKTIHISRAVELTQNTPNNKDSTKSEAGDRIIPIPEHLWTMLQNTKKTSIYIIPSAKDTQMSKQAFRKLIEPIQDKLSYEFTFHQLRHTYATLLEKMGISPKMCQYLLGHATEATTKKIYTHVQSDYVNAISGELNNMLKFSQTSVWKSKSSQPENTNTVNQPNA